MAEATFSLDLHVLSPPLTFALSQDQTLHRKFEPALRCVVWERPGDSAHAQRGMVSFSNTKPTIFKTACYPVFRDRSLRGSSAAKGRTRGRRRCFLSGLDEVRRGSVLIRGTGRSVNADRRFFRDPLAYLSNLEILQRFSDLENSGRHLVPTG